MFRNKIGDQPRDHFPSCGCSQKFESTRAVILNSFYNRLYLHYTCTRTHDIKGKWALHDVISILSAARGGSSQCILSSLSGGNASTTNNNISSCIFPSRRFLEGSSDNAFISRRRELRFSKKGMYL